MLPLRFDIHDPTVIEAVVKAQELDIADYILVGDKKRVVEISNDAGFHIQEEKIFNEPNTLKAIGKAVELVSSNRADILMKGMVHTDDFLRGVLDRDVGLRTGKIMKTEPYGYLLKPFNVMELKLAIELALYRKKVERMKETGTCDIQLDTTTK